MAGVKLVRSVSFLTSFLAMVAMVMGTHAFYISDDQDLQTSVLSTMYPPSRVFLLCLLTGSSCAVFYTKSSDNDYPRIGRRSFYTSGNGNHYPRIGRRDAPHSQFLLPGSEFTADFSNLDKRGVFTQGQYGSYPRVGRSSEEVVSGEDFLSERNKFLEKIAGIKEEADEEGGASEGSMEEGRHLGYALDIMFIAFDTDNDGQLSKDEFTSGMAKYRQQNPMC